MRPSQTCCPGIAGLIFWTLVTRERSFTAAMGGATGPDVSPRRLDRSMVPAQLAAFERRCKRNAAAAGNDMSDEDSETGWHSQIGWKSPDRRPRGKRHVRREESQSKENAPAAASLKPLPADWTSASVPAAAAAAAKPAADASTLKPLSADWTQERTQT
jgi:hypothetical protein